METGGGIVQIGHWIKKHKFMCVLAIGCLCVLPFANQNNVDAKSKEIDILNDGDRVEIRVALATGLNKDTFTIDKGEYIVVDDVNKKLGEVEEDAEITVKSDKSNRIEILIDGKRLGSFDGPITFKADNENKAIFSYDGRQYRGNVVLDSAMSGVMIINQLDVEYYLYGVVGMEMSPSYPKEALRAQAIAARSYALSNLNANGKYDVTAGTSDQAYGGYTQEKSTANTNVVDAVDDTVGKVIVYEDKKGNEHILTAFFHANGGGYTESSRNAWGGAENPCLVGVASPYDAKDNNYSWTVEYTPAEIEKMVNKYLDDKNDDRRLGAYVSIEVQTRTIDGDANPSDRVSRIVVAGEKSTIYIDKENIRSVFGLKSTKFHVADSASVYVKQVDGQAQTLDIGDKKDLYSSTSSSTAARIVLDNGKYFIKSADGVSSLNKDQRVTGDKVIFEGFGSGHGVGMSQAGARYMALDGKSYTDILDLYYNGKVSYLKTIYK
ncbi:MAG: SpoIID/LytB domain-containing protein [Peptococcaceae bacterium]|nr:SpoIID/LytB domain-containing protein [Peptococcaceae bacterium]